MQDINSNILVKKPNIRTNYTAEQISEIMNCADPITGPQYFMKHFFWIQHTTRGKIKCIPYEYQERLLDCFHENTYVISLLARQMGKCVEKNSKIKIRNKKTHKIQEIKISKFFKLVNND